MESCQDEYKFVAAVEDVARTRNQNKMEACKTVKAQLDRIQEQLAQEAEAMRAK